MAKSKKKSSSLISQRNILILCGLAVAVLAGWYFWHKANPSKVTNMPSQNSYTNLSPATAADKSDAQAAKAKDSGSSSTPYSPDSVIIAEAKQDSAGADVVVMTELHGIGWSKCTITLEQNNHKVTRQAGTIYQPEFSSCLGFAISSADFPAGGAWKVSLSASKTDGSIVAAAPVYLTIRK
jgi:hypothetical protein